MNRNTGEGPGGNRGPLLLCFLCLHHPVEAGFCPARRLFCHVSGRAPVGAGVPDGPLYFLSARRVPRFRARVTFGRSPKSDQKRCLKPQVSRLPARLGASGNVTVYHAKIRIALIAAQRIACGPLIAAAPAYGAVGVLVFRLGDYQIAHLPPPAASACAARWAAENLRSWYIAV